MGLLDNLRKLTQPMDDDEDAALNEDSPIAAAAVPQSNAAVTAQAEFEKRFSEKAEDIAPANEVHKKVQKPASAGGSIFGNLGKGNAAGSPQKPARPTVPKQRTVNYNNSERQLILASPRTFDEAGELLNHLSNQRSVLLTLEGQNTDDARRLLDFISGMAFALHGKITPVASKTYVVEPENANLLRPGDLQQPESDGQDF